MTDHSPAEEFPPEAFLPATLTSRGGWSPDFVTRPSAPPIYMTTAFDLEGPAQLDDVAHGRVNGYIYTRDGNPNQEAFANDVARLEGAEAGVVSASGMGGLTAILLGHLRTGDRIIAARGLYGRTVQLLNHFRTSYGIEVAWCDANHPEEFAKAVTDRTKLCLVESLSNPLLEVADLPAIATAIGSVPLLVDNTFATPCLLRPLDHGAKLVWHSASKYLNGHGDVMLGVVVGKKELIRPIRSAIALAGTNANPFETWLASRGLRTLPLRMQRVSQSASELVTWLETHPQVIRVFHPGAKNHPSGTIARRLLVNGFGGMLSFEIAGGPPAVETLFNSLAATIPFSPTLADARTTVSYPAGTSHKFLPREERQALGITDSLIRLSVGLEEPAVIRQELETALATI